MFETFDLFRKVFVDCTANFGCMVIDNKVKSINVEDKVFWYRAPLNLNFSFGSEAFKRYHKQHYDENYMDRPRNFSYEHKKKLNVNVNLKNKASDY
jgi:hypothetical protein